MILKQRPQAGRSLDLNVDPADRQIDTGALEGVHNARTLFLAGREHFAARSENVQPLALDLNGVDLISGGHCDDRAYRQLLRPAK